MCIRDRQQDWLEGLDDLDLRIVPVDNWSRDQVWPEIDIDWIAPSPNLATDNAALIYPGTVLFEATSISEGRGTDTPFLTITAPWIDGDALAAEMNGRQLEGVRFTAAVVTPRSIPQAAPSPRYLGQQLFGVQIEVTDPTVVRGFDVGLHLVDAVLRQGEVVGVSANQIIDRPGVFDRLAGSARIRNDLVDARSVVEMLDALAADHAAFTELAADALLYD